jgi:hypothetical protein
MKRIRYSKYVPDAAGEMSMEDLLGALSDYLLQSGFQDSMWYELPEGEQTLDELKRAIEQALMNGEMFDENLREQIEQMAADGQLDELIEKLIERMQQEDYISIDDRTTHRASQASADRLAKRSRPSSRSPTRASTSSASNRCAICWGRSANRASGATTRAISPPASKPADQPRPTSLATRSISTLRRRLSSAIQREGLTCRSTSNTPICRCTSASTSRRARPC